MRELCSDPKCYEGALLPIQSVMRELCSRSKKLNGKNNEKTGAELPHNNAYFITLMVSYIGEN